MGILQKRWRLLPAKFQVQQRLSHCLGISRSVAQVLINRGIEEEAVARAFLYGDISSLLDPYLLKDMRKAVVCIRDAINNKKKITIYGDYDVDGVTSTALLYKVLSALEAQVDYYIPERFNEGYGINVAALERLYATGTRLLISVDCGISAAEEVASFRDRMDFIITDHHQPPIHLPPAEAILNPKQVGCNYLEKNLAGVGVAFKLCQALWLFLRQEALPLTGCLEIVAIGTIADIVSLTGENRIMVKEGLRYLAATENIGLRALLQLCGLGEGSIDAGKVGFVIAPRLNAAGRIGHAAAGVELLLTEDTNRAQELAVQLQEENSRRQALEKETLLAAETLIAEQPGLVDKTLVLSGADWHPGVIGIVASRLVAKYYRPVVMISIHDGVGRGSCRSIPGFDLYKALSACGDSLIQFGGHHQAAGLSIKEDKIGLFRERLNYVASISLSAEDYIPILNIDAMVAVDEVDDTFLEQIATLAPHGMGNPSPLFACQDIAVTSSKSIGKEGRHLKLHVRNKQVVREVIAWDLGHRATELAVNDSIYVAFSPEFHEWQGRRDIQFKASDIIKAEGNGLVASILNDLSPNREIIAKIYSLCRTLDHKKQFVNVLPSKIQALFQQQYLSRISDGALALSLQILSELGFLLTNVEEDRQTFSFAPQPAERQDLFSSPTYRQGLKRREEYMNKEVFPCGFERQNTGNP